MEKIFYRLDKGKRFKFVCYCEEYVVVVVPRIDKPWVSQSPAILIKKKFEFVSQHRECRGWMCSEIDKKEYEAVMDEVLNEVWLFPELSFMHRYKEEIRC